ncbi:helix-turn-helix domain-containing protein [Streptomyces sp. WAC05374]|uniref:helix-turn-helix domain-containing protein n=1 Tax=Streptomyces sp. WAC05374 TaxID=2487420 RepID=UPI000F86C0E4|nr:helix-turn-helix transcriptional regulator [Streptomyces sp. WAC05374]RST11663.1 helix-turn-helix domain-containing protein [Streptomyces sp. WAC05374]TDF47162.1 helix-turn-helix domain-containing protein [Streptomyces sp. WAC05374]TDF57420.1 helix-turn-helix domain-containing protein [Streptomyces sp. WAC05374]TDF61525.1 helix-turn-helix domain-containing protein [Streptomyces sp. WAC05374]
MSDNELGLFLRTRREAVTPAEVGLPAGSRRRTPGLRRAELATLAGVSVEYVTRLEQGRDRHPSPQVVAALAEALRLTASERIHLHRLTKNQGGGLCTGGAAPALTVRPTVRALLDRLEPAPAVLVNRIGDLLAWTDGYDRLARPVGLLDGTPPNLARFVFGDERARATFPDWDRVADEQVAALKQGPFRVDPHVAALADELTVTAGAEFTGRVERLPGLPAATGITRFAHPEAGALRLAYETLELPADDDQRLIVHLPADDATASALDGLTGRRPGALRAVSG